MKDDAEPNPTTAYGVSKLEAEQVRSGAASHGLQQVILRLPLIFGPGAKANFLQLIRLIDSGIPLPLAAVRNRRSMLYSGNAAEAIRASIRSIPQPGLPMVSESP